MWFKNKNITTKRSGSTGFTMIELLVVATIVVVLTTIGLTSFRQAGLNARNSKRRADLESVRQALVLYRTDEGTYPVGSEFSTMISDIQGYYSATQLTDPQNVDPYVYTYSSDGYTFTLTAMLEPDPGTSYSLTNP